ncbi:MULTISPECIES: acyl-CoA dehydrogenase family protein [Micromonospora]|uniref:Acyl-CoA dehydrogenase n=1 Tax=Micromonospora aurantiaca (nom. illeg.) TaxID=47850 RepID=A0ABQ6UDQ9_9ACTN|nr:MULTISPECIES: acyl-CoA dehydrogenase family protein [Micromonospora]AXO35383.1 butyryl-CoA dehydrogenase [Micromonospora sp. B006]KAB1109396.1 acyl-CoA dehydrogenase [Micromonospora aurantiaca]MBF5029751.1 acyl-CoA dehydrogenase family protein [Micromonospora sp. ANENR4]MCO1617890.1 acyl-CoA dehydrogenase family protein [Micromonospora sp. CPM1]MCZ7430019.1 acyl-CoA dehydrogenase family protein [Micromonospora sp. WMMA1949]
MDFALSDTERAIRDTARDFITREVMPLEQELLRRERAHRPGLEHSELRELQLKARKFGFWGLATPEEYGGMDLPAVTQSLIWTELGRSFVPFRFGGEADNILFHANDEQKREYLVPTIEGERRSCFAITEPGAGSDAANIKLSARRDGDDWILNGEKTFITGGHDADFAIVIAVTDREKGARHGGATAFLVDRSMGWRSEFIQTMGEGGPASLVFDDVRVPGRNILGEPGQGFSLGMEWIGKGRYIIPSHAVGIAERALSMAIDYANTRETFGAKIGTNQAIQWMIADSETELEAARWLILRAAWTVEQGMDPRHASSMAKLYGAGMVNRVVDRVLQIHGGMGYTRELPIERWYRQVRLYRIFEGTDEMQRLIISRDLLRGYTKLGGHLA